VNDAADSADHPEYEFRIAAEPEAAQILAVVMAGFGEDFDPTDDGWVMDRFEAARSHVAVADGSIVGHAGAYTADLSVPGGTVPAAHVTLVAVAAEHRRRGLLTRLMARQLTEVRDGGREPLAVLWASEGRIYQRYGYGLATQNASFAADSREISFRRPPVTAGRLRTSPPTEVAGLLRSVYERVAPHQPGWSSRNDGWWVARLFDPKRRREGASMARATLYHTATGVDGYALWRMRPGFDQGGPCGEVLVIEVVATTTEATVALWRHLFTMDLTRTVRTRHGALHEPLWYLLDDPPRLRVAVADGLWLRVVDVPAARRVRRYAAPVDVVFEVTEDCCRRTPDGTGCGRGPTAPRPACRAPTRSTSPATWRTSARRTSRERRWGGWPTRGGWWSAAPARCARPAPPSAGTAIPVPSKRSDAPSPSVNSSIWVYATATWVPAT
jgi:predicted acetyltransferase